MLHNPVYLPVFVSAYFFSYDNHRLSAITNQVTDHLSFKSNQ